MYLAPLNYDRFFKKVFSHKNIAQKFLEDVLDVTINDIQLLDTSHFLTDSSSRIEFDFRCKIDDNEVIIDMQQWYKADVIHRFYTYHAAGTILQLENINTKHLPIFSSEKNTESTTPADFTKNYCDLKPVITIIWMVDDTLHFKENSISYCMTPEFISHFIRDNKFWDNPQIRNILQERNRLLQLLNNDTKNLDFLAKNRLIFLFQKNIIADSKNEKYIRWFKFAAKTKLKDNDKSDFQEFTNDPIFKQIMQLIVKNKLNKDELQYILTEEEKQEQVDRWINGELKMLAQEAAREVKRIINEKDKEIENTKKEVEKRKKQIEKSEKKLESRKKEIENNKKEIENNKKEIENNKKEIEEFKIQKEILKLFYKEKSIAEIATITGKSQDYIQKIIQE